MADATAPAQSTSSALPPRASGLHVPLPWIVVAVWVVAAVVIGYVFGIAVAILVLAGGSIVAIAFLGYRTAVAIADSSTGVQLADVRSSAAQDRKRAALAALKDLEYERSIGNVTEEDYEQLLGRYREEAKRAMRLVDDERHELRERAEALVTDALADAPKSAKKGESKPKSAKAEKAGQRACASCRTKNDLDAAFCKKCGTPLEAAASTEPTKEGDA